MNFIQWLRSAFQRPVHLHLHFLHIGKTGGTAMKFALRSAPVSKHRTIHLHSHDVRLRDIPWGEKVIFCLRDPVSRFVSGFYSRQRQGQPRIFSPWSPAEAEAFGRFTTANQLASSLSSSSSEERAHAEHAMHTVQHLRSHYWEWFESEEYFRSRLADIAFIGFQETLTSDFERFKARFGIPDLSRLPTDDLQAHRNPSHVDKALSPIAVENVNRWYQPDYQFIDLCRRTVSDLAEQRPSNGLPLRPGSRAA